MYKPRVGRNTRLTTDEVKEYIESFGYSLLSEYKDSKTKILVSCPNEEHEAYYVKWSNFVHGKRCPKCKEETLRNTFKKSDQEVRQIIESNNLKWISGTYENFKSRLTLECPNGHIYETSFAAIHMGHGCPHCYGNAKLNYEYVLKEVEKEGFSLISDEYINSSSPLEFMCPEGHVYTSNWNKFQGGRRCPICQSSSGIQIIISVLEEYGIHYELEYRFADPMVDRYWYDVLLPYMNTVIEFDGSQHYLVNSFGKDLLELMNLKYRDRIKTSFCYINGINLIRIPYWDINNIRQILIERLNLFDRVKFNDYPVGETL